MSNAWAIGLYSYSTSPLKADSFKRFYDAIIELFASLETAPTYVGVEGVGFKGSFTKFGGRTHTRLLNKGFADIQVLSLVSNPESSDAPGYDSHCSASLAFVPEAQETLLCVSIDERFADFGGSLFEATLDRLVQLQEWDFGFAVCQPIKKKPEFHVLGLNGGELSAEEIRLLNAWYASPPETRLNQLRDVYPYVILNEMQLTRSLSDSSLKKQILADRRLSLTPIQGGRLYLLKTPLEAIDEVRNQLLGLGMLIT